MIPAAVCFGEKWAPRKECASFLAQESHLRNNCRHENNQET